MRDDAVTGNDTVTHKFTLTLNGTNNLNFENGQKTIDRSKTIGAKAAPVVFNERISGTTLGFGFNVGLSEGTEFLTSADVTIG